MAEPTVQVPVSLIERAPHDRRCASFSWNGAGWDNDPAACNCWKVEALSPPTPTPEHAPECFIHHTGVSQKVCTCRPVPSIADMVPGTTFTEESDGWPRSTWIVGALFDGTGKYIKRLSDGWVRDPKGIDPSTIRDVTPPTKKE